MGSPLKPGRQKRVKGQCPLQGAGTASLLGFGATPQLFHGRPVCQTRSTKGAGSEASLPVTLRFRRSAPKLLYPTSVLCRAKWARPCSWSYNQSCSFAQAGESRLRARPKGNENRRSLRSPFGNLRRRNFWGCLRLDFYRCRKNRACGRESFHHWFVVGRKPRLWMAKSPEL